MKQWISGVFQLGAMLLALLVLTQEVARADAVPQVQQAAVAEVPANLGWMLEQHWRVVHGLK